MIVSAAQTDFEWGKPQATHSFRKPIGVWGVSPITNDRVSDTAIIISYFFLFFILLGRSPLSYDLYSTTFRGILQVQMPFFHGFFTNLP